MNWFLNRSVRTKLLLGFSLVAVVAGAIGGVGVVNLWKISAADTQMYEKQLVPLPYLMEITKNYQSMRITMRDAILASDQARIEGLIGTAKQFDVKRAEAAKAFEGSIVSDEMRRTFEEYTVAAAAYAPVEEEIFQLIRAQKDQEALDLIRGRGAEVVKGMQVSLDRMAEMKAAQAKVVSSTNTQHANRAVATMIILLAVGVIASMMMGLWIANGIATPMRAGVQMMQEMAQGSLTRRLQMTRKDEIGDLARAMDEFARDLQTVVVATMNQIASGDLSASVRPKSDKDEIAPTLATMLATLRNLNQEILRLSQAATQGQLSTRGEANQYSGAYQEMVQGINATLDAVIGPVNEAAAVLEQVANRDLSARMKGDYCGDHARIKDSLNRAVQNLDDSLQQVIVAVEQVASASAQVGSSSQDLARGASEQASALEEVSSSLQEMTSMTRQNAANAKEARGMAEGTRTGADRGLESMQRLSEAMERIKASSDSTAKIVKTIDEIAFQTNLLALNAAVEAARAGDAGKGFAVVAEEVRNLAMRSAEAAKNTANMIEESVHNAERGAAMNGEVLERLQEINTQAGKVSEVMGEITASSEQQTQGIDQISSAVEQMNQVTQQNAAGSEESASASEEMSAQAEELRALVSQFRLSAARTTPAVRRVAAVATGTDGRPAPARPGAARRPKLGLVRGGGTNPESVIPLDDDETLKSF